MKLTYFKADPGNFGDDLNAYMWEKLLPRGFLDQDEAELFIGTGSILRDVYPPASRKIVMGSGCGGYSEPPVLDGGRWHIVFVRGPRTAALLGLPADLAICDSDILVRALPDLPQPTPGVGIGFIPHYESLVRGNWHAVCARAGVTLIDPTAPPQDVIAHIRGASVVIAEAMHGAIVADALRTPWIALRPIHAAHHMKWRDWADSLGVALRWAKPVPSSMAELATLVTGRSGRSRGVQALFRSAPMRLCDRLMVRLAAARLREIAKGPGTLSTDRAIEAVTARALAAVHGFVAAHRAGRPGAPDGAAPPS